MRLDLSRFDPRGIDRQKLARIVATVAVAMAAGHLVQTLAARHEPAGFEDATPAKPVQVVQLAASADLIAEPPARPAPLPPAVVTPMPTVAAPPPLADPQPQVAGDPCPVTMDLMADAGAMIGLTLLAPCRPGARVVITHAGLAISVMTTATGSLFLALPALQAEASIEARFADGTTASGTLAVPDLAGLRRFGVQWQGDDAFQVYGYEATLTISAINPGLPPLGDLPIRSGFLTRLGDADAENPLLAEIYTFPATDASEVVVEAAVTPGTCGREILGETLASSGGAVTVTELTLAMPDCDAVGDFLVLNNLAPALTLTAAN